MKYIILFFISLNLPAYEHKLDCTKFVTACQLIRAHKQASIIYGTDIDISDKKAIWLANKLFKAAKRHKIPVNIFAAIGFQESKYIQGLNNKTTGYRHPSKIETEYLYIKCMESYPDIVPDTEEHNNIQSACESKSKKLIIDVVYTDLGVMQAYQKTIRLYDFDPDKLLVNMDYALDCAAIILSDFKKMYGQREIDWYTRYNAGDPIKRIEYKNNISRWL
jgi:hypothetical protein